MTKQDEQCLLSILSLDEEIDKSRIDRAIAIIKGEAERPSDLCRVIRYKEAMRLLGVKRSTIQSYIRRGYLTRVLAGSRAIGVTSNSLDAFRQRRIVHKSRRALQPEV